MTIYRFSYIAKIEVAQAVIQSIRTWIVVASDICRIVSRHFTLQTAWRNSYFILYIFEESLSTSKNIRYAKSWVFWYSSTRQQKSYARIFHGVISIHVLASPRIFARKTRANYPEADPEDRWAFWLNISPSFYISTPGPILLSTLRCVSQQENQPSWAFVRHTCNLPTNQRTKKIYHKVIKLFAV